MPSYLPRAEQGNSVSIYGILNKLVPEPPILEVLLPQLAQAVVEKLRSGCPNEIDTLVTMLHTKAVAEPKFTSMYADVTSYLLRTLRRKISTASLRAALIKKCEDAFEELFVVRMDEEDDYADTKFRKIGNMRFVAELHNRCLISSETTMPLLRKLLGKDDDIPPAADSIEALRTFLLAAGSSLDQHSSDEVYEAVRDLQANHPSTRVRLLLLDVLDSSVSDDSATTPSTDPCPPPSPDYHTPTTPALPSPARVPQPAHAPRYEEEYHQGGNYEYGQRYHTHHGNGNNNQRMLLARLQRTVYVVGIDSGLSERDLLKFITQCGPLAKVRLCGNTQNRTIYGFFEFLDVPAAAELVNRSGTPLGNYTIHCSWARSPIRDTAHSEADSRILTLNFNDLQHDNPVCQSVLNDPAWRRPARPSSELRTPSDLSLGHSSSSSSVRSSHSRVRLVVPQKSVRLESKPVGHDGFPVLVRKESSSMAQPPTSNSSLPDATSAVANFARTARIAPSASCKLDELGAGAVVQASLGGEGWKELRRHVPDFLAAIEREVKGVAIQQMLVDGVEQLSKEATTDQAWNNLGVLLTECLKSEVVDPTTLGDLTRQLSNMEKYFSFSTAFSQQLNTAGFSYSVIAEIFQG